MKIVAAVFALVSLGLCLTAYSQGRTGGGGKPRETSATIGRPPPQQPDQPPPRRASTPPKVLTEGLGVCLIADEYVYITDPKKADKCEAILWLNAVSWAVNQRRLIDESMLTGDALPSDGPAVCRSCSGTCQTVALPIKDSTYEDVEADSGLSPAECLVSIRAICESGSYRHFATARCGN